MGFLDFSRSLKELRLMQKQSTLRFIFVWLLIVMRLTIFFAALYLGSNLMGIRLIDAFN
jgi:hypothetical protein